MPTQDRIMSQLEDQFLDNLNDEHWDQEYKKLCKEEEQYEQIYSMLLMSGEYRLIDIDKQVHEILDNPTIYKEYFN